MGVEVTVEDSPCHNHNIFPCLFKVYDFDAIFIIVKDDNSEMGTSHPRKGERLKRL